MSEKKLTVQKAKCFKFAQAEAKTGKEKIRIRKHHQKMEKPDEGTSSSTPNKSAPKNENEKFTRRPIPDNFIKKLKTNSGFAAYLTGELSTHKKNAKKNSQWCCSENRSKQGDDNFIPPSSPLSRLSARKCKLSTKPNKSLWILDISSTIQRQRSPRKKWG